MKKFAVILLALVFVFACQEKAEKKTEAAKETPKPAVEQKVEYVRTDAGNPIVLMKTTMGDIEIEVFEKDSPIHAQNFLKLVENEYYDDLTFHRISKDFVIQGGDPTGTGGGGPGYRLDMEEKVEVGKKGKTTKQFKYKNKRSYLAMAQSPQGVNGSQFYFLVNDAPHLDAKFPCFAKVIKGMDVVDAMNKVKTKDDKPVEPVKMLEVTPKPPTPPAEG